jgi:hypothetical protein
MFRREKRQSGDSVVVYDALRKLLHRGVQLLPVLFELGAVLLHGGGGGIFKPGEPRVMPQMVTKESTAPLDGF